MSTFIPKSFSLKLFLILVGSLIAASGTMPYGFRFAAGLEKYGYFLFLSVGGFLAAMSLFANMALGSYSLINANFKQKLINPYFLGVGSIFSALPYGFICYFGFKDHLPFLVNFSISLIVVVVNTAIAYSAIYNFLQDMRKAKQRSASGIFKVVNQSASIIGFIVSLTTYVAVTHGMTYLLQNMGVNYITAFYIACIVGVVSWIPFAALYSNSTKVVSEQLYVFVTKNISRKVSINKIDLIILVIAIGSGASFAQIAIDFFDPSGNIPLFFKGEIVKSFIHHFLVPCAFFSSAAVNYLALQRLYERGYAKQI